MNLKLLVFTILTIGTHNLWIIADDNRPDMSGHIETSSEKNTSSSSLSETEEEGILFHDQISYLQTKLENNYTDNEKYDMFYRRKRESNYTLSEPKTFPYAVFIGLLNEKERLITICGGTLITKDWVLTAKSCGTGHGSAAVIAGAGGNHARYFHDNKLAVPHTAQLRYAKIHPVDQSHKDWRQLGLLKVDESFEMTMTVGVIKLAKTPWEKAYRDSITKCHVTAFGPTEKDLVAEDDFARKSHRLEVKQPCPCLSNLIHEPGTEKEREKLRRTLICSQLKEGHGLCPDDIGSGLVCGGLLRAVALNNEEITDHKKCKTKVSKDKCGGKDVISVFQDVVPFESWINQETGGKLGLVHSSECLIFCSMLMLLLS